MLSGKAAIVTGAGRGVGRAIARALAGRDMAVALVARSRSELERVAAEIETAGGRTLVAPADVADERQAVEAVEAAVSAFGRLDVLVNNAGIGLYGLVEDYSLADWQRTLATNLTGPFLMSRATLPHLKRQPGSAIIAIGSGAGLQGYANLAAYAASKFGLRGFMQSLAQEAPGVKVCTILAGTILTDFGPRSRAEKVASGQKLLAPEDVADAVVFLLRQSERAWSQELQLWPFKQAPPRRQQATRPPVCLASRPLTKPMTLNLGGILFPKCVMVLEVLGWRRCPSPSWDIAASVVATSGFRGPATKSRGSAPNARAPTGIDRGGAG